MRISTAQALASFEFIYIGIDTIDTSAGGDQFAGASST